MHVKIEMLNQLIKDALQNGDKPEKLLIGYKAYADLMSNPKFSEEVTNSALNPEKRKYKKIKIKITQDDYQLKVI
ncbi:hypothetical protein F4V57_01075 [Acinetobacter qingfengensis]|uniref:Uncharacterized protein n=1 Tax=Acinetobacter qingfengensis TaxID=1262585 RepID=A0A1E7R995_9GAMM|nr:hypothetical protein [Acinetobacter qingfengensis]KAA8735423.1 hypothetical protein F4V57_01075 [Acinetobacter qingfengensis]OEY95929.1 hypothetical protein BJI46_03165 [Acinetobacter qingfengensis]